jgi:hypothetical protein
VNRFAPTLLVLLLTLTASGCDLVGDVLEFGFWLIVILIAIIVLLGWGIARMVRGRGRGPRNDHTP